MRYAKTEAGEAHFDVVVFGCMFKERTEGDAGESEAGEGEEGEAEGGELQARKVLVLYDHEQRYFFLGSWPQWQRVPNARAPATADFDRDNNDHVRMHSTQRPPPPPSPFSCAA